MPHAALSGLGLPSYSRYRKKFSRDKFSAGMDICDHAANGPAIGGKARIVGLGGKARSGYIGKAPLARRISALIGDTTVPVLAPVRRASSMQSPWGHTGPKSARSTGIDLSSSDVIRLGKEHCAGPQLFHGSGRRIRAIRQDRSWPENSLLSQV